MKSILQSALLYACVTKMQKIDERTLEVIRSYIYTFWLLQFSAAPTDKELDARVVSYDLWILTLETLRESKGWSNQHSIIAENFLKESYLISIECVERFSKITTVPINLADAKTAISDVYQERNHVFGNLLTWEFSTV